MDLKLELVCVPVTDVDAAKKFYVEQAGFVADHDQRVNDGPALRAADAPRLGLLDLHRRGPSRPCRRARSRACNSSVADADLVRADFLSRGMQVGEVEELPWGRFVYFSGPGRQQVERPADRGLRAEAAVKLKLDLHDIYNRGDQIEKALQSIMDEAVAKKAPTRRDHPGQGIGAAEEARAALSRPQGHQGDVSPRREGQGQLRTRLRALPLEVTDAPAGSELALECAHPAEDHRSFMSHTLLRRARVRHRFVAALGCAVALLAAGAAVTPISAIASDPLRQLPGQRVSRRPGHGCRKRSANLTPTTT